MNDTNIQIHDPFHNLDICRDIRVVTVLRWRRAKPGTKPSWSDQLLARRPTNVVLVAMANKTARVAWALLRYERIYRPVSA